MIYRILEPWRIRDEDLEKEYGNFGLATRILRAKPAVYEYWLVASSALMLKYDDLHSCACEGGDHNA